MSAVRPLAVLALGAAVLAGGVATGAKPPARTSVGVYSERQAQDGAQIYAQRCAMCHGRSLEGTYETPGLTGKFLANWGKRPLGNLYDYVDRAMPQFAPRTLTPTENAALMAFLLKSNGMPAGREALPADSAKLHAIILDPPGLRGK